VVAVPDGERERRPEGAAVAQAGEHLDLVRLDPLARAAAVALLAAAQVAVDRLPVEDEPRRETGEDRDERWPVRLAGRDERERHAGNGRPFAPATQERSRVSARHCAARCAGSAVNVPRISPTP